MPDFQMPRLVQGPARRMVGLSLRHTVSQPRTHELWRQFMPRLKEIEGRIGSELYALQRYDGFDPARFGPKVEFEMGAAVEVEADAPVPAGMQVFLLPAGEFAVFLHRGPAAEFGRTSAEIYGGWLPQSRRQVADWPHFQVMDHRYKGGTEPDSEEEVWVPLR